MSQIFIITLIVHVISGLVGFIATYAILMALFRKESSIRVLRFSSALAFLSYMTSWLMGGYYYVLRYGPEVKPVIKSGDNPWAHSFFMETKEHIFLLLPVLTFMLALIFFVRGEEVVSKGRMKRAVIYITVLTALLALFITASGIIISGSAR
ncbi:hypothetical protein HQ403_02495 [Candidatus Kaiserbacteria bacterium]|nr:hypothetical protein [Candidatus Kaiserbacteria bacterium]